PPAPPAGARKETNVSSGPSESRRPDGAPSAHDPPALVKMCRPPGGIVCSREAEPGAIPPDRQLRRTSAGWDPGFTAHSSVTHPGPNSTLGKTYEWSIGRADGLLRHKAASTSGTT